jgi:crotonobetainyl-CoA:carnitine CoA-transferase CaiB-like acyl-CoA transferase
MTPPDTRAVLDRLWRDAGHDPEALDIIELTGTEPVLPSSFAVGTAAQASIAAAALAAGEIWRQRTGRRQPIAVDMRAAAIEFRSERYLRIDGQPAPETWDKIAGAYRCRDGWLRLHTNFPHHRDGVLRLLQCDYDRAAVGRALERWTAEEFETAAADAGLVVAAARRFETWDAHPQGRAVAAQPLVTIEKIGEAPVEPLPPAARPLAGVRVLDLTRIIAGPVCGRTLAAHGAEVMLVTAPHLPSITPFVIDTGRGKLSAQIDLRDAAGRDTLAQLLRAADVMVQGYRPGAIAGRGFDPDTAAGIRPGIVYVSLSAYGALGPWASRRGFDSLVQTASGFNMAEAAAFGGDAPRPLPVQALDHASGYLLAFGAMTALQRRAAVGGSWHVRVSLAQTANWLRGLGRIDGVACPDPGFEAVGDLLDKIPSGFGDLTVVRHAARLAETPPRWERPSVPLGNDPARWPAPG